MAEHALQADHPLTSQLTGHGWLLHDCVRFKSGHAAPPWAGSVTTERDCDCKPPPQRSEHVVQADQALTAQSMGHGCALQGRDSEVAGHADPPKAAAVETRRVRDCEPPPHEREHAE